LAERHILTINLVGWETDAEFDVVFEQLWLTSRDAFETGGGPSTWLTTRKIDALLRSALTDPASPEIKYIRKRLLEHGVEATTEQVASWVKVRLDPTETPTDRSPPPGSISATGMKKASESPPLMAYGKSPDAAGQQCWIIPAGNRDGFKAIDYLKMWLSRGYWALGERTPGRKAIQPGDRVCFYAAGLHQVVAYADVVARIDTPVTPEDWPEPRPQQNVLYKMPLVNVTWLTPPTLLDRKMRSQLDALGGRDPDDNWGLYFQTSRRISNSDFKRLTGTSRGPGSA
jgi:hypothetical protein